jgi:hypothetical protein
VLAILLAFHGPGCDAEDVRAAGAVAGGGSSTDPVVFQSIAGSFADLRERVVLAIEGRGLALGHVSRIGEMLDRTGRDLGVSGRTFLAAEVIEFCSSALSREVTAADPRFVAYCPYAITVYELAAEPGRIRVGYRRPLPPPDTPEALRAALACADALLEGIVREALE